MRGSTVSLLLIITWTTCLVHGSSFGSDLRLCPHVDQDGTTVDNESRGEPPFDSVITCVYPAAGACMYDSDGSISSGSKACPSRLPPPPEASAVPAIPATGSGLPPIFTPHLSSPSLPITSTSTTESTSNIDSTDSTSTSQSNSASAQSTHSVVSSATTTEQPFSKIPPTSRASVLASASVTATKRIPPRLIAAICVAIASVVVGLSIALLLCAKHRRRAAKHSATAVDHDANTVSPFTLITEMDGRNTEPGGSDVRSVNPSTITRQDLETELQIVNEKMADLQDLERFSTTAGSGTRGVSGLMSMRSSSTRGVPDVEAQLEASREQINMLVTRMQALEATTNSAYGAGISNEPPPAYV